MPKIVKLVLVIYQFLLNDQSLSELLDSEEVGRVEKPKCGRFDIKVTLINLMIAVYCFQFQNGTLSSFSKYRVSMEEYCPQCEI